MARVSGPGPPALHVENRGAPPTIAVARPKRVRLFSHAPAKSRNQQRILFDGAESLCLHQDLMSVISAIFGAIGRLVLRLLRRIAVPALAAGVAAYFGYTAMHGERGLLAKEQIQQQIAEAEKRLAEVRGERERMEQRVALLRSEHLDLDMLDERARAQLNLANPNDVIIMLPNGASGAPGPDGASGAK
jgi:cell division protein FtsB